MKAYESLGQTFVAVRMVSKNGEFPVTSQMLNSDHVPHAPISIVRGVRLLLVAYIPNVVPLLAPAFTQYAIVIHL